VADVNIFDHGLGGIWDHSKGISTSGVISEEWAPKEEVRDGSRGIEASWTFNLIDEIGNIWDDWSAGFEGSLGDLDEFGSSSEDTGKTALLEDSNDVPEGWVLEIDGLEAWLPEVPEGGVKVWSGNVAGVIFE